ncbi:MAG: hypothetical protein HY799_03865 [Nitrosomonadales bacterium]|nr:hypothetical protein [Nitrosomonadales bacterium]
MPRIRFTQSAETDLLELWVTIAEENLTAADEVLDVIQASGGQKARPDPVRFILRMQYEK